MKCATHADDSYRRFDERDLNLQSNTTWGCNNPQRAFSLARIKANGLHRGLSKDPRNIASPRTVILFEKLISHRTTRIDDVF